MMMPCPLVLLCVLIYVLPPTRCSMLRYSTGAAAVARVMLISVLLLSAAVRAALYLYVEHAHHCQPTPLCCICLLFVLLPVSTLHGCRDVTVGMMLSIPSLIYQVHKRHHSNTPIGKTSWTLFSSRHTTSTLYNHELTGSPHHPPCTQSTLCIRTECQ